MRQFFPKGKTLTAIEKNVLKLRLFEIGLILFYIEDLKVSTLASVRSTHRNILPEGTKNIYTKLWKHLVDAGIITETESEDIQKYIDYRNTSAHMIHTITGEVTRDASVLQLADSQSKYKSEALAKIIKYRTKVKEAMASRYVIVISFRDLLFESAEKTYLHEISRLESKVRRQRLSLAAEISEVNRQIQLVPKDLLGEIEPWSIRQANGKLNAQGKALCTRLFRLKLGPLAVSYLLRVSHRSVSNYFDVFSQSVLPK